MIKNSYEMERYLFWRFIVTLVLRRQATPHSLFPQGGNERVRGKAVLLLGKIIDHAAAGIQDSEIYGETAIQAVNGTAQSGVIGAYGHLHSV
jgi:hypothetical protein